MSKRKEHTFRFTAKQIAEAAAAEAKYHDERATWWNAEYENAAVQAQQKGVEIRHYAVTGGNRAQIMIDPTLSQRVEEATRKRSEHQQKAERYKVDSAVYASQPTEQGYDLDGEDVMYFRLAGYDLDGEDVMYFRLAGGQREEEKPTPYV